MARLPYVDPDAAPERVRDALGLVPPLNVFRMLAHAETVFEPWLRMSGAILSELELDPRLRELAILQVARQADAEYEWVQHVAIGTASGLTADQIAAVEEGRLEAPSLDDSQRAVLALTRAVVAGPEVDDTVFADLRRHLSPREIVELLLTIGEYWMLARVMTVLELDLDEPAGTQLVD
jgi:alkylhydroperoxidase family enzyme